MFLIFLHTDYFHQTAEQIKKEYGGKGLVVETINNDYLEAMTVIRQDI